MAVQVVQGEVQVWAGLHLAGAREQEVDDEAHDGSRLAQGGCICRGHEKDGPDYGPPLGGGGGGSRAIGLGRQEGRDNLPLLGEEGGRGGTHGSVDECKGRVGYDTSVLQLLV